MNIDEKNARRIMGNSIDHIKEICFNCDGVYANGSGPEMWRKRTDCERAGIVRLGISDPDTYENMSRKRCPLCG
jgi:hypothetical protein